MFDLHVPVRLRTWASLRGTDDKIRYAWAMHAWAVYVLEVRQRPWPARKGSVSLVTSSKHEGWWCPLFWMRCQCSERKVVSRSMGFSVDCSSSTCDGRNRPSSGMIAATADSPENLLSS